MTPEQAADIVSTLHNIYQLMGVVVLISFFAWMTR
jgi:hypothetical protein